MPERELRESPASAILVRPATTADFDRIVAIEQASFTDPWSRQSFAALLGDRRVLFDVAERADGVLVGYVVGWFIADEGEIANLAVSPEVRRRGIGAQLLDSAIEAARARHIGAIYLEVRDSNAAARTLYGTRGFAEIGRRRGYYRRPLEDALVLRLTLPAP